MIKGALVGTWSSDIVQAILEVRYSPPQICSSINNIMNSWFYWHWKSYHTMHKKLTEEGIVNVHDLVATILSLSPVPMKMKHRGATLIESTAESVFVA